MADDINMDTDLINECVKAIDLIEGEEEHLPKERITGMRQNVNLKYNGWKKTQQRKKTKKWVAQIAVCIVLALFTSSAVANAFGLNLIEKQLESCQRVLDTNLIL